MNLDETGLPITISEGKEDKNDQLQRVAMIVQAGYLGSPTALLLTAGFEEALRTRFEISPGRYVRYPGGDPENVSGDQMLPVLAAYITGGIWDRSWPLAYQILYRGGFAQNSKDMYGRQETKIPDFILFRALPLLIRSRPSVFWGWQVAWCLLIGFSVGTKNFTFAGWDLFFLLLPDLLLVVTALMAGAPVWKDDKGFARRTLDDVDDNVNVMTFLACRHRYPTFLSLFAWWLYKAVRPTSYGMTLGLRPRWLAALYWYHRAEAGGNPEIAKMYAELLVAGRA